MNKAISCQGEASNSRNDPGTWIIYYDSTRQVANVYIDPTSQHVTEPEL